MSIRSVGIELASKKIGFKRTNYAYNSYITFDQSIGKVEVVNVNGTKNLAAAVANKMAEVGVLKVSVRDGMRLNVSKSQIQYNPKFLKDASKLNELFVDKLPLYKNNNLPANISLKVLLARDFS